MENLFFREGDELSKPVPVEIDDEEVTELVPRRKSKRRLVIGIAVAAAALVSMAVLIF